MTVTVRPLPKRTYQNGIRPFRPVVPANNIRPYTIKTWRPPVPEPLRPAPLLGPKELLGLGLLVLAQLWGRLAGPARRTGSVAGNYSTETFAPAGVYEVTHRFFRTGSYTICSSGVAGNWSNNASTTESTGSLASPVSNFRVTTRSVATRYRCGPGPTAPSVAVVEFTYTQANGTTTTAARTLQREGDYYSSGFDSQATTVGEVLSVKRNGVSVWSPPPAETAQPIEVPVAPTIRPAPAYPALPQVPVVPIVPDGEPLPQPSTVPVTPLAPARVLPTPATPRALPVPGSVATQDGVVVPQRPAPVPTTPPDAHFPVPGAPPVTGNGPRPTPEGIAQELGRLEQKLARLSDPGPTGPGDGTDRLGLLFQILGNVVEFLTSTQSGGGYGLSSPCELDDNGDRIVTTVNYSGAPTTLGVVLNKLDALAGLLQVHKDLKQPNCKQAPAVGQPVTVNFVQVD